MIRKWFTGLSVAEKTIVLIVSVLMIGGLIKSAYYTLNYGGVDLRQRIVGARMINEERSPYKGEWKQGDSERLIDPNGKMQNANGVTLAPGSLYVLYLFSGFDYFSIRAIWLVIQYLLLGYIFLYFFLRTEDSRKLLFLVISPVFFFCSSFWFLHIERGQIYILYAFLFTLLYQFYRSPKPDGSFVAGVILAIAIYSRPSFAVLIIPFLFAGKRYLWYGFFSCALLLSVDVWLHLDWWKDYLNTLSIFSKPAISSDSIASTAQFPPLIEGMDNLTKYKTDFACGGMKPLRVYLEDSFNPSPVFYAIIYSLIVLLLTVFFRKRLNSPTRILLFGFALYITAEYIMPAPRGAYNLVQWIFPVFLLLNEKLLSTTRLVLLIVGLCLVTNYPFYLPLLQDLGELLLLYCLLAGIYQARPAGEFKLGSASR
jgi:hypothetical protein